MIVVYGYGQNPMKLLTNKKINGKKDVLRIVKGCIIRWRIEELFRVQKQEYHLEQIRTLSLNSVRLIHRLISFIIGHHSMRIEAKPLFNQILYKKSKSIKEWDKVKFHLYRYIRGLAEILKFDTASLKSFKKIKHRVNPGQLRFAI